MTDQELADIKNGLDEMSKPALHFTALKLISEVERLKEELRHRTQQNDRLLVALFST